MRAVEFTNSEVGEVSMLLALPTQILPDQEIGNGTADGVYDTGMCHDAIAAKRAATVLLSRRSIGPWKPDTPRAGAFNECPPHIKAFRAHDLDTNKRLPTQKPGRD